MVKLKDRSPLTFNVAQLLREPIGARREHDFSEAFMSLHEDEALHDITGSVRFTRTLAGVYVECTLHGVVTCQCMRCLQPARIAIDVDFVEEYANSIDVNSGAPLPPPDEDDVFRVDEQHMLDLSMAIREYALLALPIKPLCKESCLGLCPGCGVDLNVNACQCHEEPIDERFSALKALFDRPSAD